MGLVVLAGCGGEGEVVLTATLDEVPLVGLEIVALPYGVRGFRLLPVVKGFVFHRAGRPIKDCYAAWRAACKRAGLAGRHLHDMRRSAVRAMVRAGIPKHTAMQLSGHRTANIFDRYDIHETRDLEEATAKLAHSRIQPEPVQGD